MKYYWFKTIIFSQISALNNKKKKKNQCDPVINMRAQSVDFIFQVNFLHVRHSCHTHPPT